MRVVVVLLLGVFLSAVSFEAAAIMRRDDVPDSSYVVDASEFPAVVDLLAPGDCVATLIAPQWLLTAAHCAAYLPAGRRIPIGAAQVPVSGVVCHPDYRGFTHDLALVRLAQPVSDVTPLPLYRQSDEVGQTTWFVGRGDTGTGLDGQRGATNDGLTRAATNTVVKATARWLEFVFNRPGDEPATALEGISGDGDSGGPALLAVDGGWAVAGISAWQDADDRHVGKYGVHEFYTRISSYQGFIDATVGPQFDGEFRPCPEDEEGCRVAGRPDPVGALPGLALVLLGWRRRLVRRAPVW